MCFYTSIISKTIGMSWTRLKSRDLIHLVGDMHWCRRRVRAPPRHTHAGHELMQPAHHHRRCFCSSRRPIHTLGLGAVAAQSTIIIQPARPQPPPRHRVRSKHTRVFAATGRNHAPLACPWVGRVWWAAWLVGQDESLWPRAVWDLRVATHESHERHCAGQTGIVINNTGASCCCRVW